MTDTTKRTDDAELVRGLAFIREVADPKESWEDGEGNQLHPAAQAVLSRLDAMREALVLAEVALSDLQACPDAHCPVESCNRALPTIRALLAAPKEGS